VLAIAEGTAPQALAPDPEIGALAEKIAALAPVRSALRGLSEAWVPAVPVHGDVKFDNILVSRRTSDRARLTLIDWELAGLGIPEWDLAGVTEGLIVPAAQLADEAEAVGEANEARPMLEAYRAEAGSTPVVDNWLLVVATVGRLVQATVQLHAMRHAQSECADMALRVLDCARFLSRRVAGGEDLPVWIE
jgi:aminoglycoside phosphotransferase (APT) family kinase protein